MKVSGIYIVKNIINGKVYIGSAMNVQKRFWEHQHDLVNNNHDNDYLQKAWNKYGKDNFKFSIKEEVKDISLLIKREQYYLDKFQSYNSKFGYNIRHKAKSNLGLHHSYESKEKIRKALMGKNSKRQSGKNNNFYGKKHTEETKQKMRGKRSEKARLSIKAGALKRSIKRQLKKICPFCNIEFITRRCEDKKFCNIRCNSRFYGRQRTILKMRLVKLGKRRK